MSQKHFDNIISNVKTLLANNGWTANKLCTITGIPQPQMSKVLNGKSRFTLDQIITVAETFNVSLDYLIGRINTNEACIIPTNKEIFDILSSLLENNVLRTTDIEIPEDTYILHDGPYDEPGFPYEYKKQTGKYKAYYFSNYEPVLSDDEFYKLDPNSQDEYALNLNIHGNELERNIELNDFLTYYSKLYDVKNNASMDEQLYNTALQDRIDKLKY